MKINSLVLVIFLTVINSLAIAEMDQHLILSGMIESGYNSYAFGSVAEGTEYTMAINYDLQCPSETPPGYNYDEYFAKILLTINNKTREFVDSSAIIINSTSIWVSFFENDYYLPEDSWIWKVYETFAPEVLPSTDLSSLEYFNSGTALSTEYIIYQSSDVNSENNYDNPIRFSVDTIPEFKSSYFVIIGILCIIVKSRLSR